MRSVFEEEDEDLENQQERTSHAERRPRADDADDSHGDDREVTLSSTTLLMIFFGLVLLCALFFGLGYTLGRRSPSSLSETNPLQKSEATAQSSALQSNGVSKPSAAAQPAATQPQAVNDTPSPEPNSDSSGDSAEPEVGAPKPAINRVPESASAPAPRPVKESLPATQPATQPANPSVAAAPIAGTTPGTMVQIAAISNPADADVLVRALQKHSYTVTVRHATTDTLLHVQVGPFANRTDAVAMRQKLLADGYNAILK